MGPCGEDQCETGVDLWNDLIFRFHMYTGTTKRFKRFSKHLTTEIIIAPPSKESYRLCKEWERVLSAACCNVSLQTDSARHRTQAPPNCFHGIISAWKKSLHNAPKVIVSRVVHSTEYTRVVRRKVYRRSAQNAI